MRKPKFSVLAGVVTTLAILALISAALKPFIPEPSPNRIATYPGDFMRQAASQSIDWRPLGATAFSDARRLDRPVLLVVGHAWSTRARRMDRQVFTAPEVANYLAANFICVRVDATLMPAWLNAYLPLRRVASGVRPDFQIWALTPGGNMYAAISRLRAAQDFDRYNFHDELVRARQEYAQIREGGELGALTRLQSEDLELIRDSGQDTLPSFGTFQSRLEATMQSGRGGFPLYGHQELRPYAWRWMLLSGQDSALGPSISPMLRSSMVDVLDGGFLVRARGDRWRPVELDKPAALNAEMAWLMFQIARLTGDETLAQECATYGRWTVQSLTSEFVSPGGLVYTARQGDEWGQHLRSTRSSFAPRRLREAIPDAPLRDWAREALGLRVDQDPQALPSLTDLSVTSDPRFERAVALLRADYAARRRFVGGVMMSDGATVAARLIQIARLQADLELLATATTLFDRLDRQRLDTQVPHDLSGTVNAPEYLGDYLAFADAALQDYLATGRVVSLRSGTAVLQRALQLFQGRAPGEFRVGLPSASPITPAPTAPEIIDSQGESLTAKLIRLCGAYGRLLLDPRSEDGEGQRLLRTAFASTTLFSQVAPELGPSAAAYVCAAATIADDAFAITVGSNAVELANQLFQVRPTRLIAPAFGPVRPEMSSAAPGVYVFRRGVAEGPMSVERAAAAMPATFDVGTSPETSP